MTQRERSMVIVVATIGGFLLLFGGFIFAQGTLEGLEQKDRQIDSLRSKIATSETELLVLAKKQSKLRHWQAISLPADRKLASRRYDTYIRDLCQRHFPNRENEPRKWQVSGVAASGGGRNAGVAAPITLTLTLTGITLPQLLDFLEEFHAADIPHLIRHMAVTPQGNGPEARLDVTALKIEALALPAAADRESLPVVMDTQRLAAELVTAMTPTVPLSLRGIARLSPLAAHGSHKLAAAFEPKRDYTALAIKNVFLGLKPPSAAATGDRDILKGVQLTAIQADFINTEAWVRNRFTNEYAKLRAEAPFDTFKIHDRKGETVLNGKVVGIEDRQVEALLEIGSETRRCVIHIGQFLDQAWRDGKKVSDAETKPVEQDAKSDNDP